MDKEEIIKRLEKLSGHAVHVIGEPPFVPSIDDGIALVDAVFLLRKQESVIETLKSDLNKTLAVLSEQPEIVRCKDCRFRDDPNSVISEWLPCQFGETPDNWYCASGRTVRENRTAERR